MKKNITILFFLLNFCSNIFADEVVTLTVNGQGQTKEQATTNALRSAIEQTFGVFVSSNTQILNDDLVKDEIARFRLEIYKDIRKCHVLICLMEKCLLLCQLLFL